MRSRGGVWKRLLGVMSVFITNDSVCLLSECGLDGSRGAGDQGNSGFRG